MQQQEQAWLLWSRSRRAGPWEVSQHLVGFRHVGVLVRPFLVEKTLDLTIA